MFPSTNMNPTRRKRIQVITKFSWVIIILQISNYICYYKKKEQYDFISGFAKK